MRYLCITEYVPDDEMFKAFDESSVVRETYPDRFPKQLFPDHQILGDLPKLVDSYAKMAFTIFETDDPKQLEDLVAFTMSRTPEMKTIRIHVLPITEVDSFLQKIKGATRHSVKSAKKNGEAACPGKRAQRRRQNTFSTWASSRFLAWSMLRLSSIVNSSFHTRRNSSQASQETGPSHTEQDKHQSY